MGELIVSLLMWLAAFVRGYEIAGSKGVVLVAALLAAVIWTCMFFKRVR